MSNIPSEGDSFGNLALKNFHEFSVPNTIEWLPLAPGWKAMALILLGLLVWQIIVQIKKYRTNVYRRKALQRLKQIDSDFLNLKIDHRNYLQQVRQLLKATALRAYQRSAVASLNDIQWIDYLNKKTKKSYFHRDVQRLMDNTLYQERYQPESQQLKNFSLNVARWITHHD